MNDGSPDLQRQALDYWQVARNRLGLIVLSVLLVFSTAAILTYIMPRKYRGRAEMKIERVANKLQISLEEFDKLKSEASAVGLVSLNKKWYETDSYKDVREIDILEDKKGEDPTRRIQKSDLMRLVT